MLRIEGLTIGYGARALTKPFSMELAAGECVLLAGANGSGKSTLLRTLASLQKPLGGSFSCDAKVIYLPTGIPKVNGFTVRDFVETSFASRSLWGVGFDSDSAASSKKALELLGLLPLEDRDISSLSDGEFQKACIATALARLIPADGNAAEGLLLLDEPTSFLDVDGRALILETLSGIAKKLGVTVLFSSHDIHLAAQLSDRVMALTPGGEVMLSGRSAEDRKAALAKAFISLR